ncbi:Insect cuticle protein [Trinorchestia longiramus]|nr:Insect cuticle protein [Trinorchestia longiramus]
MNLEVVIRKLTSPLQKLLAVVPRSMKLLIMLLLYVAAIGALDNKTESVQTEDESSSFLTVTPPVIVSVSTSVSTSVSSSNEPAPSTVPLSHAFRPSKGKKDLDGEETPDYKPFSSPQQKTSRTSRNNLSVSARLRRKLFPTKVRQETAIFSLSHKARTENFPLEKTNELQNASKPQEIFTSSTTVAPVTLSDHANIVGPALLAKEIAIIRGLESTVDDDISFNTTGNTSSNLSHLRIQRKYPTISPKLSTTTNTKFESKKQESLTQKTPTTFSDLIKERFPDSRPPTIVKQIQPAFKSIIRPEFRNGDFALYGKHLSIQKAILEKEIINFKGNEKQAPSQQTAVSSQKEHNTIVAPKTSFKKRDIEDMPKKFMQVVKQHEAGWVTEQEAGVMLPALDGSGIAFVPKILIEDTEFLLSTPSKTNFRWESEEQSENSTSPQKPLNRLGRDAQAMERMSYSFGYIVDDEHTDNFQTRYEEGDVNGVVNGCYQVLEPSGLVRTVTYRADSAGFTVLRITEDADKSPCPGLDSAGQFSALSASTANHVNRLPKSLSGRVKSSFSSAGGKDIHILNNNARLSSSERSNYPSIFHTIGSPQNRLHMHSINNLSGDNGRISLSSLNQHGHPQQSRLADSGRAEQISFKNKEENNMKTRNYDQNKSSSSHNFGTASSNLHNNFRLHSQQQSTKVLSPHIHRNIRHEQNQRKNQSKTIFPRHRKPHEHEDNFGTQEVFSSDQGLETGPRVQSSFSPESSGARKISTISEQGHTSRTQEAMSKYLQSLSDELYNSFSASNLAGATSSDNLINFPFVLIPVSTFINLRKEGHINGDVQSFGAFIQPVQNRFSSPNHENKRSAREFSISYRSQSKLKDNELPLVHPTSKEPAFTQLPNFKINHKNEQPQFLNSYSPSQRSTRGSRTIFLEKHTPRPYISYPKVTSIAYPLLPTKVSFTSPSTDNEDKPQNKHLKKINELNNLYDLFRHNNTGETMNILLNSNSRGSLAKPITATTPFSVSQSSVLPGLYAPGVYTTHSDFNSVSNSPNLSLDYLPFSALSAFVRTGGDFDHQSTIRASSTHTPTQAVTAAPLNTLKATTQNLEPKRKSQFDLTYTHLPKGKPPLTNYGYLSHDNLKLASDDADSTLALSYPINEPVTSVLSPNNEIQLSSPEPEFLLGNSKTMTRKNVSNKRAPIPAYLRSLSDPSLSLAKSILGGNRGTKHVSNQRRQPRTLQFNNFGNDNQVSFSAGKFKPPTKLESMVDSPVIHSSDWMPMFSSPSIRLSGRASSKQVRTQSLLDNVFRGEEKLTPPVTSIDHLTSHLAKTTRNLLGSSNKITGQERYISSSLPRTSTSASRPSSSVFPISLEPLASSTVSKVTSLPRTTSTVRFTTRTPSTSKRQAKESEIEFEVHSTNESLGTLIKGKSTKHSFNAVGNKEKAILEVTTRKNEGFGQFHTRESSKKVNPIDGSEFNSHFYSQAN